MKKFMVGCLAVVGLGVVGMIALFVVVGIFGSRQPAQTGTRDGAPGKTEEKAAAPVRVGDRVESGNWAYQVSKVDRQKEVTWSAFGNKTEAKGIWQVVHLKLKNIGKESYSINAHDFEIRDAQGITYKPDGVNSSMYSKNLKLSGVGETFPPGVDAEIALLTDVNPEATGLKLWLAQARTLVALE